VELSVSPPARRRLADQPSQGRYCLEGHSGPRCTGCIEEANYFNGAECQACPNLAVRFAILLGVAAAVAMALFMCSTAVRTRPRIGQWAARLSILMSNLGIQAKLKIVISFYQVSAMLSSVYGVSLHPSLVGWLDALYVISLDIVNLSYPSSCLGSMVSRLLVNAFWPFALVLGGSIFICLHVLLEARCAVVPVAAHNSALISRMLDRSIYFVILVFYLVLPTVARTVFIARQCESFAWRDEPKERISYLLADPKIYCNSLDGKWSADAFAELQPYFWASFVLWPVVVPLTFLVLLLRVRASMINQRITGLANACRFLWRDYNERFHYWEIIDLVRKVLLTAIIIFINVEPGSSRILRLVIAAIISGAYLAAIAVAHPFRRADDLYLACLANLLLTCCFISGIVIQICEGEDDRACLEYIGLGLDWYSSTVLLIVFSTSMLAATLLIITGKVLTAGSRPTFRLVSSGREPDLKLSRAQHIHAFISHLRGTGQDQVKCGYGLRAIRSAHAPVPTRLLISVHFLPICPFAYFLFFLLS
jgi:hypothetical protein